MSKRATAVVEDRNASTNTVVSEAMEPRKHLAARIRARMAKPATTAERKLWQELKSEVSEERLTFRS